MPSGTTQSASSAFIDALQVSGVSHIFANLGSDHPAFVEAYAEARAKGRVVPELITCPNEMVALSAAHGHALVSGQPQAVVVHVDCGTQALAGAIHNAMRARIPVLVFAGAAPFTQEGELTGSRNEFIHWLQDVRDQRGIMRGYTKFDAELRTGRNIRQMTWRALQIAQSEPRGPVYLMGAREVMEEIIPIIDPPATPFGALAPRALDQNGLRDIVADIRTAQRPLIVTSYVGRDASAIPMLVALAETAGLGVLESAPSAMNFPADHVLYQGNQWNEPRQNQSLASADFVLVIDCDVPWIPLVNRPDEGAVIRHIDVDPLKRDIPLWSIGARSRHEANSAVALTQIFEALTAESLDTSLVARRVAHWGALGGKRRDALVQREEKQPHLTAEYLTARLAAHVGEDAIVLNEGISHYHVICDHMRRTRPGTMFTSGSSSLGWNGGAALGVKLAQPDSKVVAMCGDGSYLFSIPSTVHWMARHYRTPFLQVVYNNRGWKSPKLSTLAVHPDGYASRANDIGVTFDPPPDYAGIATAAGGALAVRISDPDEVDAAIARAWKAVTEERRCAVIDAWLPML
jgi:acetolactate synthase-1/2/3 large subunit